MTVSDWSVLANLATALGTLILAIATFSAIRASNLMAKVAQQQFLAQMRPVLSPSRMEDPPPAGVFFSGELVTEQAFAED